MNARALLISLPFDFHSSPKHNHPPDISASRKIFEKSQLPLQFRFRIRFLSLERSGVFATRKGLVRRGTGKVWAEVKSEPYDVADSAPQSVKLKDALSDVVLGRDGDVDEELDSAVPWWEEFPKRWVIVILCFSAFLLCNMDRVRF